MCTIGINWLKSELLKIDVEIDFVCLWVHSFISFSISIMPWLFYRFFNFNFINFYSFAIQNINSLKHCQWIYLKFCEIKNFQWSLIFSNILDYLDNKVHPNLFVQPRIVPSEYRGPAVLYFEVILFLVPSEAEFGVW